MPLLRGSIWPRFYHVGWLCLSSVSGSCAIVMWSRLVALLHERLNEDGLETMVEGGGHYR